MAGNAFWWNVGASKRAAASLVTLVVLAACQPDSPTATMPIGDVGLAKGNGGSGGGSGGGGGGGTVPTVTATDPASAVRDTTIDVTIFGSGFTTGAKATWALAGDTSLVHVKSTKVVASDRIVARIQVPANAPVASYDVEVTLSNGKKGVGAELFTVEFGDPTAAFWFPLVDAGLGLRSDHLFVSGASSVYADGVCGVGSRIFATNEASNSGDAVMGTGNPANKDRKCAAYPRTVSIEYGPGDVESSPVFMNVREIANTTYTIPIGATVRRALTVQAGRCESLRFNTQPAGGSYLGADSVNVTRTGANSWLVETQDAPANKAYCNATGRLYNIAVRFTVFTDRPLP